MRVFVTGGCGFIGSSFLDSIKLKKGWTSVNLDIMSYAANAPKTGIWGKNDSHKLVVGDICNKDIVTEIFENFKPNCVINFAAETHVDRSISNPSPFISTNIQGVFTLLECSRHFFEKLSGRDRELFNFLHISTDEVFGDLGLDEKPFSEDHQYKPSSPYSASKAASDHLVKAWKRTYGLPTVVTNCSNNFGPRQHCEKLIPTIINRIMHHKKIPIYGDGLQIRDWLFVEDHVEALIQILETQNNLDEYNIGGNNEISNIAVVDTICDELNKIASPNSKVVPISEKGGFHNLKIFVKDRPGHDRRYSVDISQITQKLGWKPKTTFSSGVRRTIDWYINKSSESNGISETEYWRSW